MNEDSKKYYDGMMVGIERALHTYFSAMIAMCVEAGMYELAQDLTEAKKDPDCLYEVVIKYDEVFAGDYDWLLIRKLISLTMVMLGRTDHFLGGSEVGFIRFEVWAEGQRIFQLALLKTGQFETGDRETVMDYVNCVNEEKFKSLKNRLLWEHKWYYWALLVGLTSITEG